MAINLSKGQRISLEKEAGGALSTIIMGLGWDAKKSKGLFGFGGSSASIDLDASCLLYDADKNMIDAVWFRSLKSKDGTIRHSGDNRTGDGDGDDEQITVDLSRLPDNVTCLMFIVNSFTGQTFATVENAFCRIVNGADNTEIAKYNLSCQGNHTGQIMARIYRHNGEWKCHAIGENTNGRTFHDMQATIAPHL